ncbi:MAG: FTR1 family protein [Chloroflexota bacterium]|nr:FTR1 family protein [Chloroflexota bacterium]
MPRSFIRSLLLIVCLALILPIGALSASAENAAAPLSPPQTAEQMRQRLFEAQMALMSGDNAEAVIAIQDAEALYADLHALIGAADADGATAARITDAIASARAAIDADSTTTLALARAAMWTALLDASTQIVASALTDADATTAAIWLPLREYRVATRFTRPTADATLALSAFAVGTLNADAAWSVIRADLLDTYQAQMTAAFTAADEANRSGFALRRAEEVGLAAGYFTILADSFAEQRGAESLSGAQTAFAALTDAALTRDELAYADARTAVESVLVGFRAVPLSDEELARRAGQFSRYLTLVPIEYGRGVRDGVITNDIEIQEALTFHGGAVAAYADLEVALSATDPDAAAQIDALLIQALDQIRAVVPPSELETTIAAINETAATVIPAEWLAGTTGSDVDVVLAILDQIDAAVVGGDYRAAESARLEAYALLELGFEQRLVGFAPEMAARIESYFWQGTADQPGLSVLLASSAPIGAVRDGLTILETGLGEARLLLGAGNQAPGAVVGNAAIIVFREGLEGVLILASLLASLRAADQVRYRRPLVIGAILAFGATALVWWGATSLLTVLLPFGERLEAVVSLIAIGVLLLITNWFFHKTYWTGWMANFHARKRQLVTGAVAVSVGQAVGLVLLGFTSVFREGFETVLFLQSLVLEAGTSVVLQGVAIGLVGTAIVGVITFALQVRLPYKKMLIITGIMISAVLMVMVGNTAHVLQSVGWMPITPINGLYLPFWMGQWFGVFATWEGVLLQFMAGAFVIGSYFLAEQHTRKARMGVREVKAA